MKRRSHEDDLVCSFTEKEFQGGSVTFLLRFLEGVRKMKHICRTRCDVGAVYDSMDVS
jgi:hypothetical protein